MTRDDIIKLALEAEATEIGHKPPAFHFYLSNLERFAALVAAAEREACARVCEELELKSADGEWGTYVAGWSDGTDDCAAAIRARGEKT